MKSITILLVSILLLLSVAFPIRAQELIWSEDFSSSPEFEKHGQGQPIGITSWTADGRFQDAEPYYGLYVRWGYLFGVNTNNANGHNMWSTDSDRPINISAYSDVSISVDAHLWGAANEADEVQVQYKIDNGTWTNFSTNGHLKGNFGFKQAKENNITGNSLQIRVMVRNGILYDVPVCHCIDNIRVDGVVAGDYRTKISGEWSKIEIWEILNSGSWVNAPNVPDKNARVTICAGHQVNMQNANKPVTLGKLVVEDGGGLLVRPGEHITINGHLYTGNGFVVENTSEKPTSLINRGVVTGNVKVKWRYDNGRWWFVGHVISNPSMASYENIRTHNVNNYAFYDYQDGGQFYKPSDFPLTYDLAAQNKLRGYQLKVLNANTEVLYEGRLNYADEYTKQLQDGWQIVANPYASYYQLPMLSETNTDFANTTGSVYLTEVATSNKNKSFVTYNTLTSISSPAGFTGVLAPSQGFYVKTDVGKVGQHIAMRANNRVHDQAQSALKSTKVDSNRILRLKLDNGHFIDEAVIALVENGSQAYNKMDSEQCFMSGGSMSYVYSIVDESKVVINALPKEVDGQQVCLGIQAQEGKHVLYFKGLDFFGDNHYNLILEDKLTETFIDIKPETRYVFESDAGTFNERFVLYFKKNPVFTDIKKVAYRSEEGSVNVYVQHGSVLHVRCDWLEHEKNIRLFTIEGKEVLKAEFQGTEWSEELPLPSGIYILTIRGENKISQHKIFIKK